MFAGIVKLLATTTQLAFHMLIEDMDGSCEYAERIERTAHSLWRAVW